METLLLNRNQTDTAAAIIQRGGLVAVPTETVYGLAADALNGKAVAKIFRAKGRPMDNPLIVHISEIAQISGLVSDFPEKAQKLADAFWPGPLTIILPKSDRIPDEVSAGLDTVAIRLPMNECARELIAKSAPLAAPSANLSGSPSPTTAEHVKKDMYVKIDAILDGGDCEVGVESTVITLVTEVPRILRPGGITAEQIIGVIGETKIDDAVLNPLKDGQTEASPGMKYKHYSPKANVVLLKGNSDQFIRYVNRQKGNPVVLCYEEEMQRIHIDYFSVGKENDYSTQAHRLFALLRDADEKAYDTIYAHCPKTDGISLAVYNRIIRAAGFEVTELEG